MPPASVTLAILATSAPDGLTAAGWLIMLAATLGVTVFFLACLSRILRNATSRKPQARGEKQQHHP